MVEVIPAILTDNQKELEEAFEKIEGKVVRVQIDIVDGKFAANKTIDPTALEAIETSVKVDFHLMVQEPVNWVEKCVGAGADRVIGQVEKMSSQEEFVSKLEERNVAAGLALDLETGVEVLERQILPRLEVVLVMSVPAGFGGQKFDPKALEKIKALKELRDREGLYFKILDDGGITLENIADTHLIGVDEVAVGERLFAGAVDKNLAQFKEQSHELGQKLK